MQSLSKDIMENLKQRLEEGFKEKDEDLRASDFNFIFLEEGKEVVMVCKRHLNSCRAGLWAIEDVSDVFEDNGWILSRLIFNPNIEKIRGKEYGN